MFMESYIRRTIDSGKERPISSSSEWALDCIMVSSALESLWDKNLPQKTGEWTARRISNTRNRIKIMTIEFQRIGLLNAVFRALSIASKEKESSLRESGEKASTSNQSEKVVYTAYM